MMATCVIILVLVYLPAAFCQCEGTTITLRSQLFVKLFVQSPNFTIGNYSQNLTCAWMIERSNVSHKLLLRFYHRNMVSTQDIVKIFEVSSAGERKIYDTTGNISPIYTAETFVSGNLSIQFATDAYSTNDGGGFELIILESTDKSGTGCSSIEHLQAQPILQYVTSPNFPLNYNLSINCYWNISQLDKSDIVVSVIYMDVEQIVCYDKLIIGGSVTLCGDRVWNGNQTYLINDTLLITFTSDNVFTKRGFVLSFTSFAKLQTTVVSTEFTSTQIAESTHGMKASTDPSTQYQSIGLSTIPSTVQQKTTTDEITTTQGQTKTTYLLQTTTRMESTMGPSTNYQTLDSATGKTSVQQRTSINEVTTIPGQTQSASSVAPSTSSNGLTTEHQLVSTRTTESQMPNTSESTRYPLTDNNHETSTTHVTTIDSMTSSIKMVTTENGTTTLTVKTYPVTQKSTNVQTTFVSTTTKNYEVQPLSSAAVGGIIAGAIIGVMVLGILLSITAFCVLRYSTQNSHKYVSDSRETTKTITADDTLPTWVKMIDTMKKQGYNPTFLQNNVQHINNGRLSSNKKTRYNRT